MPYAKNSELPDTAKGLPGAGQTVIRKVLNSAYDGRRESEMEQTMNFNRELRFGVPATIEQLEQGGAIIRDVKLLAVGAWKDSLQRKELYYSDDVLQSYATNWKDKSFWSRHTGGFPRSLSANIGEVQNIHYEGGAVVGDLFFHLRSQESKDTLEIIKYKNDTGHPASVSVEHHGAAVWDKENSRYMASEIVFTGLAAVNRGACSVCTIENEDGSILQSQPETTGDKMTESDNNESREAEQAAKIAELEAKLEKKSTEFSELGEKMKAKETEFAELGEKFDKFEERIKAIEAEPEAPMTHNMKSDDVEMTMPEIKIRVNRSLGEVYTD